MFDFISTYFNSWNVIRSSGITAYVLLFFAMFFGLSHRLFRMKSALVLHQVSGWFSFLFALIHGVALTIDPFVSYSFSDVFVPFSASYKPVLSGLGTVSLFLLFSLILSSDMMKRVGRKIWRIIHYLSTPAFVLAAIHGIFLGTDTTSIPMLVLYSSTFALILFLFIMTFLAHKKERIQKA